MKLGLQIKEWERQLLYARDSAAIAKITKKLEAARRIQSKRRLAKEINRLNDSARRGQKALKKRARAALQGAAAGKPKDSDVAQVMRSEARKRAAPWEGFGNRD